MPLTATVTKDNQTLIFTWPDIPVLVSRFIIPNRTTFLSALPVDSLTGSPLAVLDLPNTHEMLLTSILIRPFKPRIIPLDDHITVTYHITKTPLPT